MGTGKRQSAAVRFERQAASVEGREWTLPLKPSMQRCWVIWSEIHQKKKQQHFWDVPVSCQVEDGAPNLCWFSTHRPPSSK